MDFDNKNKVVYLKDYTAPTFTLEKVELEFDLDRTATIVSSKLYVKDNSEASFLLNGSSFLQLLSIEIDGVKAEYELHSDNTLEVKNVGDSFVLSIKVEINPEANTTCEGLYISDDMYTTQCEAESFRHITYFPDRPDVLSEFFVTIRANGEKYNTWLSNGNQISKKKLDDGRVETIWHDPFLKPCYLFALVVGNLGHIEDSFTTKSGRKVELNLYCERGKETKLGFAMEALKKAMRWDEERFGREYDLDIFNIVAVSSFIFGAMENKSLNIFNDAVLLADKDTATDLNYKNIMGVVAHEYFHNWSGNRVTLRNWFELSLKEGFTVYRDQLFSADEYSPATQRIENVEMLRISQFPEDNGPLSHPVRAEQYISINNFYTSTVYNKGAEIVRMYEKLLGWEKFRKACDLYFEKFDGKAVTINDFASCMEEISGKDLTQFKLWYSQNGTPTVIVETLFSEDILTVRLKQVQEHFTTPLVIPLEYGLIDKSGKEVKSGLIIMDEIEKTFNFDDLESEPVLSLNRGFSAPVKIDIEYTKEQIETLLKYDTDLFNRYDIGQKYALDMLLQDRFDNSFIETFGSYLDLVGNDNEFIAQAISLPSVRYASDFVSKIDYDKLIAKHKNLSLLFAQTHKDKLLDIYYKVCTDDEYSLENHAIADRALKGVVLYYLSLVEVGKDLAIELYNKTDNLTDRIIALSCLRYSDIEAFDEYMAKFYESNKHNHLVMLKWLKLEASTKRKDILEKVKTLLSHEAFDIRNPNKARSLIGGFANNLEYFHAIDGSGYEFIADMILELDKLNPTIAAGISEFYDQLPKLDDTRKELMSKTITRILHSDISSNVREILEKIYSQLSPTTTEQKEA